MLFHKYGYIETRITMTLIIIMEIHKVPTQWLKALNKHNTNNVHQDNECYPQFNKQVNTVMYTSTKVQT